MPALSAVDAIGPAIKRTKTFLFRPFRWPTFLKLCLVAALTEGYGLNINFNSPMFSSHSFGPLFFTDNSSGYTPLTPGIIAAVVVGLLLFIVLGYFVFYLITRLRFAYFHCLVTNTRLIRPGWRLYRSQAIRFFWLNVIVGICFLLFAAIPGLPLSLEFWHMGQQTTAGGQELSGMLFLLMFIVAILLSLAAAIIGVVLRDFIMPHFALENATASQAWTAAWASIKAEKLPFFVYVLLRLILPFTVFLGILLVLIIPALLFLLVLVFVWIGIQSAFAGAASGVAIIGILLKVLVTIVGVATTLLVSLSVGGPLSTAIREYALLFYGARYDRLGAFLFPPPETPLPPPETPLPPPLTA